MSAVASTPRWSWNAASRAGRRYRPCNFLDFPAKNAPENRVLESLYRRKLAGIIPRPANRPPSIAAGLGATKHAAHASGCEARKAEESRETAVNRKEPGREVCRGETRL